MKKIIIVICIMFLFTGVASAKITTQYNSFDGSTTIISRESGTEDYDSEVVTVFLSKQFSKNIEDEPKFIFEVYNISFNNKWRFLSSSPFEIKINDDIYKTSSIDTKYYDAEYNHYIRKYILKTKGSATIDSELAGKISNAKTIVIRFHFNNQPSKTWNMPKNVLEEWKEVIRAEKDYVK